jgi:hypothetical protein
MTDSPDPRPAPNPPHDPADDAAPLIPFELVPLRERLDGWTPERQVRFIQELAETGDVSAACRNVGMSRTSAYGLFNRPDAQSFRQAWEIAMTQATRRLADTLFARALHGTTQPVFHGGEQVGERRVFNDRTAMSLLRTLAPERFGKWRETTPISGPPDRGAQLLTTALKRVIGDAILMTSERPVPPRVPLPTLVRTGAEEEELSSDGLPPQVLQQLLYKAYDELEQLRAQLRDRHAEVDTPCGGDVV